MAVDLDTPVTGEQESAETLTPLERIGVVTSWSATDKSALVSGVVLVLVLWSLLLLTAARSNLEWFPFIDPEILDLQIGISFLVLALWVALGATSLLFRRKTPESRFFTLAPILLYAISNSILAYFFGYFTEPYGFMTLVGGMMIALPMFGRDPTRLGLLSWLLVFGVLTTLEQRGDIPYAPLLKSSPVVDGSMSLPWALGMGSINVSAGLLAAGFGFFLFGQLRRRDQLLRKNQDKLLEVVADQAATAEQLRESRNELEIRVEERTLELKVSNRNLQFEIEKREESAAELNVIRTAMEEAIEGVARVDSDGRIESANAAFLSMHGEDSSDMVGSPANAWIDPQARADLLRTVISLAPSEKAELTVGGLRKDGSTFSQFIALVRIPGGQPGEHYRFARDVTRQTELSEQLNHSMKMEAIGHLAGGIAHDFNNLLMAILTGSERLKDIFEESPSSAEESEIADMIMMAGKRAAALTSQLLDFAHVHPPSVSSIDINQSVRDMLELLAPALSESIRIESDFCEGPIFAFGDASRFDSGLLNVALNARDAMPDGGTLSVRTRIVDVEDREQGFPSFEPKPGRHARIDLKDDGEGMDAETAGQVFDPFFTTKPVGKGTGLGLSVFSTYIREVKGALGITSRLGEGTLCSIYVPLSTDQVHSEDPVATGRESGGGETILLAEDEDIVAQAMTMLLSHSGYRVIRCADGREAVECFRERKENVDLALLDFRMPIMTGAEAYLELRSIDPDLPVILMSGNLSVPEFRDLEAKGLRAILRKPCSRLELMAAIRGVLGEAASS